MSNSLKQFTNTHMIINGVVTPKYNVKVSYQGEQVFIGNGYEPLINNISGNVIVDGDTGLNFANAAAVNTWLLAHLTDANS